VTLPHYAPSRLRCAVSSIAMRGYVPDGLSEAEWQKMRAAEAAKARNLGKVGVDSKRFRSRSMKAFMEDLHSGKAAHLFPVSPAQVRSGKVARKDVPYMQRKGGSWDDSDLNRFGRSMKAWRTSDVDYE